MMNIMNMMVTCVVWLIPSLLQLAGNVCGVSITDLSVPSMAIEGDEVHLRCDYEDEGGSSLYTLKWYKNAQEFFRHQPGISPHTAEDRCADDNTYAVDGVNVDCWVSTEREVVLKSVSPITSGEYTCEVIGEHPTFRKEVRQAQLTVYSEPLQKPLLTGKEESYTPMDRVALNCTSMNTEYVPYISWYINGRPAHQSYVRQINRRTVGLVFQALDDLFLRGVITVSCKTSLGNQHAATAKVELQNRDSLSAQEYYYNAGKKKSASVDRLAAFLLLHWLFAFVLSSL